MVDSKMPFNRSLLWILVSTLLISGSAFMGWLYFLHVKERRLHDDQYRIVAIIQSTPQSDALKTIYLAELLSLSLDRPINLYQFKTKEAIQTLLRDPLIKSTNIKKILPGTLYIHYQMRTPIAYIGDFSNTAIDEDGVLFPYRPFFTPKRLPTLFLGLEKEAYQWGDCLKGDPSFKLTLTLLQQFKQLQLEKFALRQLDVSHAAADSYGQRQIILVLDKGSLEKSDSSHPTIFLRLSSDHTTQDLENFRTLQATLIQEKDGGLAKIQSSDRSEMIIDLRIPHLAFVKTSS